MIARITIVGRPNVGKSSIFNSLTRHKIAIVSDIENTTRDILEFQMHDHDEEIAYIIADSGGLAFGKNDEILADVRKRVQESVDRSDIILFVLEYDRITDHDAEIAKLLRKSGKKVIVIANKADNPERMRDAQGLLQMGFPLLVATSSLHTRGIEEVRALISSELKATGYNYNEPQYADDVLKIAIIGRPNVGKSSLVNAITGENRSMVMDLAGTTRDSIDTVVEYEGQKIVLIDTAGIRRSGKIGVRNLEDWSVMRSERAIARADIAVIVMDANEGITGQDQAIVGKALELAKGLILVFNKWDIVLARKDVDQTEVQSGYNKYLDRKFEFIDYVTPIFTTATNGKRVDEILTTALQIQAERQKRVKTGVFNSFLEQITYKHAPSGNKKSHKPKIFYGSQVDVNPPKFLVSVNNEKHFHFSYPRYIENQIREHFGFAGTPIIIELKGRESIYKKGGGLKTDEEKAEEVAKKFHGDSARMDADRRKRFSRGVRKKKKI
ncbi:MAG: ribosome biogenesis GTPase Der [Candidatus Gracilibacteria bacterium]|nr:ribosome biogenesis GTPase Der [Candidatus Gracilibacteria bacterium]